MNVFSFSALACPRARPLFYALAAGLLLAGCSSDDAGDTPQGNGGDPMDPPPATTGFTLESFQTQQLIEGDGTLQVPVTIVRGADSTAPVQLSLAGDSGALPNFSASLAQTSLVDGTLATTLDLNLNVSVAPIVATTVQLTIDATDGTNADQEQITIDVQPTDAPDVYLLIGQSNMVGASLEGAKNAAPGAPDEPNARIRQLNVTPNERSVFATLERFSDPAFNARDPLIVTAQDPLHRPAEDASGSKSGTTIGMGLSFAKSALANTSAQVVLVPAAWGGTGFCGVPALNEAWNAEGGNPSLGGTGLYDRAVTRTDMVLQETGGVLRGILWHQGETDGDQPNCAPLYQENVQKMVSGLRSDIQPDARGNEARGPSAEIPFVLGTLSRGVDERGDFSNFSASMQIVDQVHRNIQNIVPFSGFVNNDDLVPPAFPCGSESCIHFGATAYREIGDRYYRELQNVVAR